MEASRPQRAPPHRAAVALFGELDSVAKLVLNVVRHRNDCYLGYVVIGSGGRALKQYLRLAYPLPGHRPTAVRAASLPKGCVVVANLSFVVNLDLLCKCGMHVLDVHPERRTARDMRTLRASATISGGSYTPLLALRHAPAVRAAAAAGPAQDERQVLLLLQNLQKAGSPAWWRLQLVDAARAAAAMHGGPSAVVCVENNGRVALTPAQGGGVSAAAAPAASENGCDIRVFGRGLSNVGAPAPAWATLADVLAAGLCAVVSGVIHKARVDLALEAPSLPYLANVLASLADSHEVTRQALALEAAETDGGFDDDSDEDVNFYVIDDGHGSPDDDQEIAYTF